MHASVNEEEGEREEEERQVALRHFQDLIVDAVQVVAGDGRHQPENHEEGHDGSQHEEHCKEVPHRRGNEHFQIDDNNHCSEHELAFQVDGSVLAIFGSSTLQRVESQDQQEGALPHTVYEPAPEHVGVEVNI